MSCTKETKECGQCKEEPKQTLAESREAVEKYSQSSTKTLKGRSKYHWSHSLLARIPGFHPGEGGSKPPGITI